MNHMGSEETSNDGATIISELLNSAEDEQLSSTTKMPLQQKDELQLVQANLEIGSFCDPAKQNIMMTMKPNNAITDGGSSIGLLNSTQFLDAAEDLNKINIRHVHIPYILNGELYQIQTQDGENVTVKCCHCPPDRVYRGSVRSTGNFHMHIKRRHPDLLEKLHDMKVNALLERRDRLMRNRKITHRANRNRSISNVLCSFKNEEKPELVSSTPGSQLGSDTTSESSLIHTHKLKIKTVFQRHQMQQKAAAEMRNWNNSQYVVMPITKIPRNDESEQPINYSLKSQESQEINNNFSTYSANFNQLTQQKEQEKKKSLESINQTSFNNFTNFNNHTTNLSTTTVSNNNDMRQTEELICENHHKNDKNLSIASLSISCPSVMSSYSSTHQYDMGTNRQYHNLPLHHDHHHLSIVKPEHMLMGTETEAIDLTTHTDSGIFSNFEDSVSLSNNNSQNNSGINNRAGSQKTNITSINATVEVGDSVNTISNNTKWQELLIQVENSLRDIQREMNVRNQIESNRMFLDIAKFKFLNPGFQFNW